MTKIKEAIILAGGFGTRLQHIVHNVPKPMADINDRPFLSYLLENLNNQGIEHVVLSTGYLHEIIYQYFKHQYKSISISYSEEKTPLLTGGAIQFAIPKISDNHFFVLNGDTFFDIDFHQFETFHQQHQGLLSVALCKVENTARYGTILVNKQLRIVEFTEKGVEQSGYINGGIYCMNKKLFIETNFGEKFSFEQEVLQKRYSQFPFYGYLSQNYFIDIGIPEDYYKAQKTLSLPYLQ